MQLWNSTQKGSVLLEFAIILPILVVLLFAIIDFGRLIQARVVVTSVSREGGSIAARDIKTGNDLITMLQSSGTPLDLDALGKIYVSRVKAGTSASAPNPTIETQISGGHLTVSSKISETDAFLGLSEEMYNHLKFKTANQTSDILEVTLVEIFYKYSPITPLPQFIQGLLLSAGDGIIIGCRTAF